MKKVMLFITSMMFAVSVNAATLNLSTFNQDVPGPYGNFTHNFASNDAVEAISFNTVGSAGDFSIGHHIVAAVDQTVNIEWSFNQQPNLASADISKGGSFVMVQAVTGLGYSWVMQLLAGQNYFFDIIGVSSGNPLTATLTINAVPIPAALFLFAPALLGFLGLRRRAAKLAA
ncbi:MAG: hypothetical protein COA83_11145 [Methylophaga sp.]|nr:MAG: hypothetical protein COA83_11145 [Methylophaga sp.]